MSLTEIILIAIGLSMDAVAVSITNSLVFKDERKRKFFIMAIAFGIFQGLMPLLGYFVGGVFADFINKYSGIVVFLILGFIGGKMLKEAIFDKDEEKEKAVCLSYTLILVQAVATSIDAFAVGVSFCAVKANIFVAVSWIAVVTAVLSCLAVLFGKKYGEKLGNKAEILGGAILIFIGIKALF